jgi:hypothetical protein
MVKGDNVIRDKIFSLWRKQMKNSISKTLKVDDVAKSAI